MAGLDRGPVLLTGATGFLGQAVLERLLADHPNTRILLLLRGRPGVPAAERWRRLLAKPVFRTWRERVGEEEAARLARERVTVVEGDLAGDVPDLPADLSAVLHCASVVSFDPPVDEAFRSNVCGVTNLFDAIYRAGAQPHVVHVSTAYVAGYRKGLIPEAPLSHTLDWGIDWRSERDWALAARARVERASREPRVLDQVRREAERNERTAGPQAVAAEAEKRRRDHVADRLIEYGRSRARSLGWPDVYTFTKALGERAAEESASELPLSIVRPAIVESALRHPYPGWIDGFKMIDPLVIACGRGILRQFPGAPDGIVDIVPVDIVVNAMLAAALARPEPGRPAYYHVGSSARNPLSLRQLYEHVREYFRNHPLPADGGRGAIDMPDLSFVEGEQADRALGVAERGSELAERVLLALPATSRTREWQRELHRRRSELDLLRRYRMLYGAYAEAEVVYADPNTFALHRSLPKGRRDRAGFDTAVIDWADYLQGAHFPSITAAVRGMSRATRRVDPPSPQIVAKAGGADNGAAAIFDLEGTVLASNVLEAYLWVRLIDTPTSGWPRQLASFARAVPRSVLAERRGRGEFLRTFLREYEGAGESELRQLAKDRLADLMLSRAWPQAIRRIRRHRAAGHRTLLVTGTVDLLVEPLRTLFDEVAASRLWFKDGRCTGYLAHPPLVGEVRAGWVRDWADTNGIDLAASWAYGDHYSDRPVLELVGNPVAVNPDPLLFRHAKRRRWIVEQWHDGALSATETLVEGLLESRAATRADRQAEETIR